MKDHPEILTSVADLVEIAGKLPPSNVVIPGGHRPDDLKLVEAARDHGIVDRIILVGDRQAIGKAVSELGIRIPAGQIVPAETPEKIAAAAAGVVTAGRADIVLKGDISTPVINRVLKPLAVRPTVSLATVFDAAPIAVGRPMILTDAGFTTVCSFGRMVDLVHNACDVARLVLGIPRPRVAIISANEKPIPSLPSTWLGEKLSERKWKDAVVYGPLSFDLATDPESVALKGISGPAAAREVAGRADILVCPGIDTANALYKTLTALNKFGLASLAGITVGFPFPYVILSRADTLETRLESIALCSVFAQRARCSPVRRPRPAARSGPSTTRVLALCPGVKKISVALFAGESRLHSGEVNLAPGAAARAEEVVRSWRVRRIDAVAVPGGFLPGPAGKPGPGVRRFASRRGKGIIVDGKIAAAAPGDSDAGLPPNPGIPVAAALARSFRAEAYAVDPLPVDDLRSPGPAGFSPGTVCALLAAARRAADGIRLPREEIKLVVALLGERPAAAAIRGGRIVVGSLLAEGRGGDLIPRVSREIGALLVAAGCDVEAVVLAGEPVRDGRTRREIRKSVNRLAPVVVFPDPGELDYLARSVREALSGRAAANRHPRRR